MFSARISAFHAIGEFVHSPGVRSLCKRSWNDSIQMVLTQFKTTVALFPQNGQYDANSLLNQNLENDCAGMSFGGHCEAQRRKDDC